MSFRPFALPAAATTSQVMLPSSSSPASSTGGSPAPPSGQNLPSNGGPAIPHKSCREAGRALLTDPTTGHSVCSCEYPGPGLIGAYPRLHPSLLGFAGDAYSSADAYAAAGGPGPGYLTIPGDPASAAALYSSMGAPFDLKDSPDGLRSLAQSAPFYYDPGLAYPYSYNGLELSSAARRKNATRENTNTLKAWLYEHRKNPYPTKGEKIMLAIITKMTLTQVSTWFANARRRLKKENKMTWSPRSGGRDDEDDDDDDMPVDTTPHDKTQPRDSKDLGSTGEDDDKDEDEDEDIIIDEGFEEQTCLASSRLQASLAAEALRRTTLPPTSPTTGDASHDVPRGASPPPSQRQRPPQSRSPSPCREDMKITNIRNLNSSSASSTDSRDNISNITNTTDPLADSGATVVIASKCSTSEPSPRAPKPRIWSLADVATSNSPPAGRRSPQRPSLRSPWAVTATYALQPHQAIHPYLMVPRTPLGHPMSFTVQPRPHNISPNGPIPVEDPHLAASRPGLPPSPLRSPSRPEPPVRSPLDTSPPHRTSTVETAFKPVHKRITTS